MKKILIGIIATLFFGLSNVQAQSKVDVYDVVGYADAQTQETIKWYRDAKFGMFVHWGLYSGIGPWDRRKKNIPRDEYLKRGKDFGANFNPDEWTKLAKLAGMKWITITSKHHDGFALYPSQDEFDVELLNYKRDPLAELKQSCENDNLKLGFYYSQFQDWDHPNGGSHDVLLNKLEPEKIKQFNRYLNEKALPQVTELIKRYDPFLIWYDTPQRSLLSHSLDLRKVIKENSASTIVCSRIGHELGDYVSGGDGGSPGKPLANLWESCWVSAISWSYNSKVEDYKKHLNQSLEYKGSRQKKIKSAQEIVERLFDITAAGGVLLLNMGPRMDGSIPDYYFDEWPKVGQWIEAHKEAIYGADVNPYYSKSPMCTSNKDKLFVYLKPSSKEGEFVLNGLNNNVKKVTVMGDKQQRELSFSKKGNTLTVKLPSDLSYYYENDFPNLLVVSTKGEVSVDAGTGIYIQQGNEAITITPAYFGSFQGKKDLSKSVKVNYGKREPVYATFKVQSPGTYNLSLNMSAPKGHGGINIRLKDKLFVINEEHKSLNEFYDQNLGQITFEKPGTYTVLISSSKFVYWGVRDKLSEDITRHIEVQQVMLLPLKSKKI